MNRRILNSLCLAALFLAGCSSSSPKMDVPPMEIAGEDSGEVRPTVSEVRDEAPVEKPVVLPTPPAEGNALRDAIKANNEQAIYLAAIDVLARNPNDIKALNALGLHHYRGGRLSAAQLMFAKALKVAPTASELHNNLALVLLAQKEQRAGLKELRRALEMNSSDVIAAGNLGSLYAENKDYTKALVALEISYRRNSKDQRIANNYAIALVANGKFSEAKDVYRQAVRLNENNKDVLLNYAILLIENLKSPRDGLDLLSKVKLLGPSPEAKNKIIVLENKAKAEIK